MRKNGSFYTITTIWEESADDKLMTVSLFSFSWK